LLGLYRDLIALRRRTPALTDPRMWKAWCEHDHAAGWFLIQRDDVTVAVNFGPAPVEVAVTGEVLLATDEAVASRGTGLSLPGHSAAVVQTTRSVTSAAISSSE
jgi:maltooligosyltrehalose trehalohydrolase